MTISPDGLNSDLHASAEYRAHLVKVMAKRAVQAAVRHVGVVAVHREQVLLPPAGVVAVPRGPRGGRRVERSGQHVVVADAPSAVDGRVAARPDRRLARPVEVGLVREPLLQRRVSIGRHLIERASVAAARIGFEPTTIDVQVPPDGEVSVTVTLEPAPYELEAVTVLSTRIGSRLEDSPLKVDVIAPEDVSEKVQSSPGSAVAIFREPNALLKVQTTAASLGSSVVRIQGLRGRYTQILADGAATPPSWSEVKRFVGGTAILNLTEAESRLCV